MPWRLQIDDDIYKDADSASELIPYITLGDNGITYFRMESPDDNSLWNVYIDSSGAWVSTPVVATGGADTFGLLALRNLA